MALPSVARANRSITTTAGSPGGVVRGDQSRRPCDIIGACRRGLPTGFRTSRSSAAAGRWARACAAWTGRRRRSARPTRGRRACAAPSACCSRRRPRSFSSGVRNSPSFTTTRIVPSSAPSIPTRWAVPDGRPGARSGTSVLHELLAGVVRTGEAFWAKDLMFELERYGFLEETYFDVSYDPVRGESGEVEGVYCIVTETTERVIGERRMALLKELAERNATARTAHDACRIAADTLAAKPHDVTFALTYLGDELQGCTPGAEEQLAAARPELVKEFASRHPVPEAGGTAGGGPQSPPPAGRSVPRVSRARRRPGWHRPRERPRLRSGAQARRSAGAARSGEDGVLQQRQPRVPHAADAHARADRGSPGFSGRRRSRARRWRSCIATSCACSSWSTRCWSSRASKPADWTRATCPPTWPSSPPTSPARSGRRSCAPAWNSPSTAPRCRSLSTWTGRCGRRSS